MLHILQISHFIRFFISRINKHTSIVIIWTCLLCRIDYIACMLLQISFHNRKKFCGISCCLLHVRRLRVFVALKISRKVFNFSRAFFLHIASYRIANSREACEQLSTTGVEILSFYHPSDLPPSTCTTT